MGRLVHGATCGATQMHDTSFEPGEAPHAVVQWCRNVVVDWCARQPVLLRLDTLSMCTLPGGRYATRTITAAYAAGQVIDTTVQVSAHPVPTALR